MDHESMGLKEMDLRILEIFEQVCLVEGSVEKSILGLVGKG